MGDDEQIRLVQDLAYEAAIIPERWPAALSAISDLSDTAGTALVSLNDRGVRLIASPRLEDIGRRVVEEGWMARSGRAQAVLSKGLAGTPRFLTEADFFAPGEMEVDPIVTDLLRPAGFGWAAGWIVRLPHDDTILLNVEQFQERGPITRPMLDRLDAIYAPVARAATLAARNDLERVRGSIQTLTAIGLPAAALSPAGRVVLANPQFDGAIHIWTTRGKDRIALLDLVADRQMSEALQGRSVLSIPVRRALGGEVVAVLQIVPVRRNAHDIFGEASCIVILSEMKEREADATLIQSLFDLTPAELGVARAIAMGQTVSTIAASTNRSVHTVRGQLKSIMSKTGSSRQAELILLMRQLSRVRG